MDLSLLLARMHLPEDHQPLPPITAVLARLQDSLSGPAQQGHRDSDRVAAVGQAEQLFRTADSHWLFSLDDRDQTDGLSVCERRAALAEAYVSVVRSLAGFASLPVLEADTVPPDALYRDTPGRAALVCPALCSLLGRLELEGPGRAVPHETPLAARQGTDVLPLVAAVAPLCVVVAVTHMQDQQWTDSASRESAGRLLSSLLAAGGWRDVPHLLMGDEEPAGRGRSRGVFGGLLDVLQPQLSRDLLPQCAAVKLVFSWALLQMSRPFLSLHLPRVIPPSLLLSDHYRPENCLLGIRCLHHIVLQTCAAELRQFNRAEVLYQALLKHLYTTNGPQIQLVLNCLLDLLPVLEKPPSPTGSTWDRGVDRGRHHDDVMLRILTNMEAEGRVALRRCYAAALPKVIRRLGVCACRHLKRVERVLLAYLEVSDGPQESSRSSSLEAMETLLLVAWPRIDARRAGLFLQCLLRLLVDVSSDRLLPASVKEKLTNQTSRCLTLLNHCSHGRVQSLVGLVDSSCADAPVLRCLETVTLATER